MTDFTFTVTNTTMTASLDTDRVNEEGDSISRIRLFPLYLLNQLTFHHFCMCTYGSRIGLPGIESRGHWSRSMQQIIIIIIIIIKRRD